MKVSFKVSAKDVTQAPRKVGLLAGLIRYRNLGDALFILEHTPKQAAKAYIKLLNNAQATAVHNYQLKRDSLQIDEVFVNAGRDLKRSKLLKFTRYGRGRRRVRIEKKRSHIFMTISGQKVTTKTVKAKVKAE